MESNLQIDTLRVLNDNNLLSFKNKHTNDSRIKFIEEGHKYFIDNDDTNIVSCTTYIHGFFEEFKSGEIIQNICKSSKWKNDTNYQYYQMTPIQIEECWEKNRVLASSLGTKLHAMIEHFYNDMEVEYTDDMIDFKQFLDFYQDHENLQIYRTELIIFANDLRLSGSIDAVFINDDGTLTLFDWKRSKEIQFKSFNGMKYGREPFEYLEDCNYVHYSLQLNLYRSILEKYYNFKIRDMYLGVFHPNNKDNKYIKINIPIMLEEGEMLLEYRRKKLN